MKNQKTAAASPKARRSPQSRASAKLPVNPPPRRRPAPRPATPHRPKPDGAAVPIAVPPLLTVTLDAEASACVLAFAEEFQKEARDVASGVILDELPQALDEWKRGNRDVETYWLGTLEKVIEAQTRRRETTRKAPLEMSYTAREIVLVLGAFADDCRRMGWMQAEMRFNCAAEQIADHGMPAIIMDKSGLRMKTPMRKD